MHDQIPWISRAPAAADPSVRRASKARRARPFLCAPPPRASGGGGTPTYAVPQASRCARRDLPPGPVPPPTSTLSRALRRGSPDAAARSIAQQLHGGGATVPRPMWPLFLSQCSDSAAPVSPPLGLACVPLPGKCGAPSNGSKAYKSQDDLLKKRTGVRKSEN